MTRRGAFRLYGVLGLAFTALWASLSLDLPSHDPPPTPAAPAPAAPAATPAATPTAAAAAVSSAASAIAAAREARVGGGVGGEGGRGGRGVPPLLLGSRRVRLLLSSGAVWVIFFSHMAFNLCIYFMTSWAPTFYSESFGLLPEKAELEGRDELVQMSTQFTLVSDCRPSRPSSPSPCRRWSTSPSRRCSRGRSRLRCEARPSASPPSAEEETPPAETRCERVFLL